MNMESNYFNELEQLDLNFENYSVDSFVFKWNRGKGVFVRLFYA